MNFTDTMKSAELVLATGEVPLIIGESGIGKTALAKALAKNNNWSLIVIDGNLLKEGEIGGLPTVETYLGTDSNGQSIEKKTTIYAVHHKLREIDAERSKGNSVLLFIDEINRCEHTVQQELMNLILNKEINGYHLNEEVKILAAMNPPSKYGTDFDYQVVDMDAAQENRFVWLNMEADHIQWLGWAIDVGLEPKVIEFISTFPEYLHKINEDTINATPRSYERISKVVKLYNESKASIPRSVFLNILTGNVGKMIAEELISFMEADYSPLISYEDVFHAATMTPSLIEQIEKESHTRLYLIAKNLLKRLETNIKNNTVETSYSINRLIKLLEIYPVDLRVGIMKDIKSNNPQIYEYAIENEAFVDLYFDAYKSIRG